jgi:putative DNA primase/helicase
MMFDLRNMARALGGEVVGGQVECPGPERPPTDRSLRVSLSVASPLGFIAHSRCGDDFFQVRDFVAGKLAKAIK